METRIAVIGIVVEEERSVELLNEILHEYRDAIIGRMGIPDRQKGISIISIAVDAPQDTISALSGKVGKLPGVSSKTAYAGVKRAPSKSWRKLWPPATTWRTASCCCSCGTAAPTPGSSCGSRPRPKPRLSMAARCSSGG